MVLLVVDDRRLALELVVRTVREAEPDAATHAFYDPFEALAFAEKNAVDVAFLDITMPEMSGPELAKRLKDVDGNINIFYITAHSRFELGKLGVSESECLFKPVYPEDIVRVLESVRRQNG